MRSGLRDGRCGGPRPHLESAREELPEALRCAPDVQGSFDYGFASQSRSTTSTQDDKTRKDDDEAWQGRR
jgi:hypothetical protein